MKNISRAEASVPRNYKVTKGLKKTKRHMVDNHNAFVTSDKRPPIAAKRTTIGRRAAKTSSKKSEKKDLTAALETPEKRSQETREAEDPVSQETRETADPVSQETLETEEPVSQETRETEDPASQPTTDDIQSFITGAIDAASEIAHNVCAPPTASINGAEEREGVTTTATSGKGVVIFEFGDPLREDFSPSSEPKRAIWMEAIDQNSGKTYYFHTITKEVSWIKPAGFDEQQEQLQREEPNDADPNAVNEETTEAPSDANAETSKTYDEMSTKLNESFSLVRNQTVNGLTAAYARAGEDLSLMGIALSQTNVAKSLNALIKGEVDYDQENEGEGMEVSLDNRVGNSRTVAEI